MSRDDSQRYLGRYLQKGLFASNPFKILQPNVVTLMKMFVDSAKKENPDLEIGICGAHAADPTSLQVMAEQGLTMDYVSVMPYSVVQAKLNIVQG